MTARLNPYLSFRGTAREAMEFYQSVLGGNLDVMTFADSGGMGVPEEEAQDVMHSMLTVSESVTLMGSDQPSTMPGDISNGSISLSGDDDATLRGWWTGLSDGATVGVPLELAPWGDAFGQLTDRFGIDWMFNIAQQQGGQG